MKIRKESPSKHLETPRRQKTRARCSNRQPTVGRPQMTCSRVRQGGGVVNIDDRKRKGKKRKLSSGRHVSLCSWDGGPRTGPRAADRAAWPGRPPAFSPVTGCGRSAPATHQFALGGPGSPWRASVPPAPASQSAFPGAGKTLNKRWAGLPRAATTDNGGCASFCCSEWDRRQGLER